MKKLLLFVVLCLVSSSAYSVDCDVLRDKMMYVKGEYKAANYNKHVQVVNTYYDSGCKSPTPPEYKGHLGEKIDRNWELGNVAFFTANDSPEYREKYLLLAYNYYKRSETDNGFVAGDVAKHLGFYYKNKGSYDNAIIWFERAVEMLDWHQKETTFVHASIGECWELKGNYGKAAHYYTFAINTINYVRDVKTYEDAKRNQDLSEYEAFLSQKRTQCEIKERNY